MSDTGNWNSQGRERFGNVVRGGLTFHIRAQGEDDFRWHFGARPDEQFADAELLRTDVVQRSEASAEDMVSEVFFDVCEECAPVPGGDILKVESIDLRKEKDREWEQST